MTACWSHLVGEKKEIEAGNKGSKPSLAELTKLIRELKATMVVLKRALQNPGAGMEGEPDADQLSAKDSMQKELQELVSADAELKELLFADVKS